jgi:hypothetical protein
MSELVALAPLAGSYIAGQGQQDAAKIAAKSAAEARAMAEARYKEYQGYQQPYLDRGNQAGGQINNLLGLNGAEAQTAAGQQFQTDPGWAAANKYANQQMAAKANASGQGLGGNTLSALSRFNEQDMSAQYDKYFGRLQGQQGAGQTALGQLGSYSAANTNTVAGAMAGEGYYNGAAASAMPTALASGLAGSAYLGTQMYTSANRNLPSAFGNSGSMFSGSGPSMTNYGGLSSATSGVPGTSVSYGY